MTRRNLRSLHPLAQLDQHSIAVRRMQKRDPASVRARHRRLVDEPVSLIFETFEMPFEIRYTKTDVMDSLAASFDESATGESSDIGSSNSRFASPTRMKAVFTPCDSTVSTESIERPRAE